LTTERQFSEGLRPPIHVVPPAESGDEATSEDLALEAVAASLSNVSTVMDHLTAQLTQLTEAFGHTRTIRNTEAEIGRLFVRAQAHVDESIDKAHAQAHQIVSQAQLEAARIVEQAHLQAAEIVEQARRSAILQPEAVTRLSSTIEGFARMNNELVRELSQLRESLAPMAAAEPVVTSAPEVSVSVPVDPDPPASPTPPVSIPVPPPAAGVPTPADAPPDTPPAARAPAPAPSRPPSDTYQPLPTYPPPPANAAADEGRLAG
jgi:hypothetical protein